MAHARAPAPDACSSRPRPSRTSSCGPATCCGCGCRTAGPSALAHRAFHYVGVAKEFPTAPTDSFLVANADYVARATGTDAVGTFLVQTDGPAPATVGRRVRALVGTAAQVTDIRLAPRRRLQPDRRGAVRAHAGRARASRSCSRPRPAGWRSALGFQERRRTFAIAAALGARRRQLGALRVERVGVRHRPAACCSARSSPSVLARMLVKVLTGVFDPPPDRSPCRGPICSPASPSSWPRSGRRRSWRSRPCAARASRTCATREAGRNGRVPASGDTGLQARAQDAA